MSSLRRADAQFASARYADAIPHFEAALAQSKRGDGTTPSAATASILRKLGVCCCELGNYATAIVNLKGALAIESINPLDRIAASDVLTGVYRVSSQLPLALAQGHETVRLVEAAFSAGDISSDQHKRYKADSFVTLGTVYLAVGRPSDALLNFEPAVELFESMGDRVGLVEALTKMCEAQREQGQLELSLATARRAESMSPNDNDVMSSLGSTLWKMGRFEEALVYRRREMESDIKQYGKRSRNVAASMMNLGNCLIDAGQRDEGISTLRRVVTC